MHNIKSNEPFYQISQAAKILNITPDRLRTYEEEGLIKPFRTQAADGKRLFSQDDIDWLFLIRDLIKLGVSIPSIRILLASDINKIPNFHKEKDIKIIDIFSKLKNHSIYSVLFK